MTQAASKVTTLPIDKAPRSHRKVKAARAPNLGTYVTATIAIGLAAIGAATSLSGLVAMFGFAFLPLGIGLEVGKLTSAAALHQSWQSLGWRVRYALTTIVVTLMVLTSSGIYGFVLTRYLTHVAAITGPVMERIAAADEEIARQADKIADLDKQLATIDAAPALEITRTAKPRTASQIAAQAKAQAEAAKLRLADEQRRQAKRDGLVARRDSETAELSRLRTVRAEIGSQQKAAEAEVGPTKLVADILGVDPGKVVAAAVAAIYDALCVLLLLVASARHEQPVPAARPVAKRTRKAKAKAKTPAKLKAPAKLKTANDNVVIPFKPAA
jgi:hypothetical protein